jgi:hypothetical protein
MFFHVNSAPHGRYYPNSWRIAMQAERRLPQMCQDGSRSNTCIIGGVRITLGLTQLLIFALT